MRSAGAAVEGAFHAPNGGSAPQDGATVTVFMLSVMIDRAEPLPLHDQVAGELRRAIAEGEAGRGERLPPARDLARGARRQHQHGAARAAPSARRGSARVPPGTGHHRRREPSTRCRGPAKARELARSSAGGFPPGRADRDHRGAAVEEAGRVGPARSHRVPGLSPPRPARRRTRRPARRGSTRRRSFPLSLKGSSPTNLIRSGVRAERSVPWTCDSQLFLGHRGARREHHRRNDPLSPFDVGDADNRGRLNTVAGEEDLLDLPR